MEIPNGVGSEPLKKIFLLGGHVVVTDQPQLLVTILGPCVAVCLWDRKTGVGGMNHFLLPETVNNSRSLNGGITSTRALIQMVMRRSAGVKNIEARIYGGANRFFADQSFLNVGKQNVRAALVALDEAGIQPVFQDTGGEPGRKIYFNTQTGNVVVHKINYNAQVTPA